MKISRNDGRLWTPRPVVPVVTGVDLSHLDGARRWTGAQFDLLRARIGTRGRGMGRAAYDCEALIAWMRETWVDFSEEIAAELRARSMTAQEFHASAAGTTTAEA